MLSATFESLGLSPALLQSIEESGYTTPTPIQEQAIPQLLQGHDLIGQAQTGTGKTAAFALPSADLIDQGLKKVQVLVLCPTRELAMQVSEEYKKLLKHMRQVRVCAVYGGAPIGKQLRELEQGVQIVVGTPGRVIDHLDRRSLDLSGLKMIILDEADEMLNMGFVDDIKNILSEANEDRQTVLFSATMPRPILEISKAFQKNPVHVKIAAKEMTVDRITQYYLEISHEYKTEAMMRLMDQHSLKRMLAFCNTKRGVDELVEEFTQKGIPAEGLHGDLQQAQRTKVMGRFKSGQVRLLIATDVAARGIDVDNVDGVFNVDLPLDQENYVHRIGRTGRAGKQGKAFNFVADRKDALKIRDIQNYTKAQMELIEVPSLSKIISARNTGLISRLSDQAIEEQLTAILPLAQQLLETGISPKLLLASAMMQMGALDPNDSVETEIDFRPQFIKRGQSPSEGGRSPRFEDRGRSRFDDRREGRRDGRNERRTDERRGGSDDRRSSGGDRSSRDSAGKSFTNQASKDESRIFINAGKQQQVRVPELLSLIDRNTGVKGFQIGEIRILDKFTFMNVPKDKAQDIIKAFSKTDLRGHDLHAEFAAES